MEVLEEASEVVEVVLEVEAEAEVEVLCDRELVQEAVVLFAAGIARGVLTR